MFEKEIKEWRKEFDEIKSRKISIPFEELEMLINEKDVDIAEGFGIDQYWGSELTKTEDGFLILDIEYEDGAGYMRNGIVKFKVDTYLRYESLINDNYNELFRDNLERL